MRCDPLKRAEEASPMSCGNGSDVPAHSLRVVPLAVTSEVLPLVSELRTRLERGELARRGRVELPSWRTLVDAELAARVVLADVDHLNYLAEHRKRPVSAACWAAAAAELRHLKQALDAPN